MWRKKLSPTKLDWSTKFALKRDRVTNGVLQDFYSEQPYAGDHPICDVPLVAIDFETTGLNAQKDEILSVGIVHFTLKRIALNTSFYSLVKPERNLNEASIVVHNITHTDLITAPKFDQIAPLILEHLKGRVVVAHYHRIERDFFYNACKHYLGEAVDFPMIDTLELEQAIVRRSPKRRRWYQFQTPQMSVRLAAARTRYGLPHYNQHHALSDAIACAELLQAQIAHHYSPETPLNTLWV